MKKLIVAMLTLFSAVSLFAQDIIIKKDGSDIQAKVLEVNQNDLRYRRADNPDGPIYTISRADILLVRYSNGQNEVFNIAPAAPAAPATPAVPETPVVPAAPSYTESDFYASDPSKLEAGMRYGKLKELYDRNDYKKLDNPRYSPSRAWFNLLVPGLAQFTMNEPGRGVKYLLCTGAGEVMMVSGIAMTAYLDGDGGRAVGAVVAVLGSAMALTFGISSLTNAVKVAKVKSLYYDDMDKLEKSNFKLSFAPTMSYVQTPEGLKPAFGAGLRLTF
ncbi:MAG: hypothetical protein IJS62_07115 [Bacteroidales bacterium]|nr:hypothetical protein [Bacteroidales bacterium]